MSGTVDGGRPVAGGAVDPDDVPLGGVPRVARPFRLQFEQAQDAWVLLYPEGMVKLNGPAGAILSRCDGEADVRSIVTGLQEAFGQADLTRDVRGFLAVALDNGWVTLA